MCGYGQSAPSREPNGIVTAGGRPVPMRRRALDQTTARGSGSCHALGLGLHKPEKVDGVRQVDVEDAPCDVEQLEDVGVAYGVDEGRAPTVRDDEAGAAEH